MKDVVLEEITIQSKEDYKDTPWKDANIPKGTVLLRRQKGEEVLYTLQYAGNVTITQTSKNHSLRMDESGKGAVLCAWQIYTSIKSELDACYKDEEGLGLAFDTAIEKINGFIAKYSLEPVTVEQLRERADSKNKNRVVDCSKVSMSKRYVEKYKEHADSFQEKWILAIDDLLSIPRPPVINPCL